MLKDFVDLNKGDTIIQNGANSSVGKAAIQICRIRGIRSINIVRKRDDMTPLVSELKSLGADEVLTEDQLFKEYRGKIKNVRLALNCVGGRSALLLASTLGHRGCMVTYGGMSKQPLQVSTSPQKFVFICVIARLIPTGPLIFKDIRLVGFWMSRWYEDAQNLETLKSSSFVLKERKRMNADLTSWIKSGEFRVPSYEKRTLEQYKEAVEAAGTSFVMKQLFTLN
ncbi:unnamed protein product [Strongylus vulgaris]|uniref:Alcohol dehydrogenase-like C-terminal domain-containing protein n=1 Tax=Strongylus vulgaris TaxID=40348 RepID=A0A3P7IKV6_STRVU|nr:unnamed protein product [Strongylus vulgaris]